MKIYNKKYLFIGILASLVTACGSSGGNSGGNSPSTYVSSSSNDASKPSTDIVLPTKLEKINDKVEEKLKVSTISVIPEGHQPNTGLNSGDNFKPNEPLTNNTGVLNVKSDSDEPMNLMHSINGSSLENSGTIKGIGSNITAMFNFSNHGEGFTSINDGEIKLSNTAISLKQINLIGMKVEKDIINDGNDEDITLINNKNITIQSEKNLSVRDSIYIRGMSISINGISKAQNKIINNGTIAVTGAQSIGIYSGGSSTAVNNGTIKSNGRDSIGMLGYGEKIVKLSTTALLI